MTLPIALQLYTVRDLMAKDVDATLAGVAEIGFELVEVAGLHNRTASDFRGLLDKHGLKAVAMHTGYDLLTGRLEQAIADVTALGAAYAVCPWLAPEYRTVRGYRKVVGDLMAAGEQLRRKNITLCYHNHDFEFQTITDHDGSTRGMETLFNDSISSFLQCELDLYWAAYAGEDPMTWLNKLPGRIPLVHVKDLITEGDGKRMTEVGTGEIDYAGIVKQAPACGVKYLIVEQDEGWKGTPLDSAAVSYENLKKIAG